MEKCSSVSVDPDFELEDRPSTPPELIQAASDASKNLLPTKSTGRYQQAFDSFQEWKWSKGATSNSERTLMAYFGELEKKFAASTLWSKYSMLKSTMAIHDKVDISTYASLIAMLKQASKGYVPKQAQTFTEAELQQFIDTAPDVAWLDVKVMCAFGLSGACRTHELPSIRMQGITRHEDMYYVTIPGSVTKTGKANSFAITGALLDYVRRYEDLRPSHVSTDRFFINFQKGKCTVQTIGKSKFYKMPRRIAEFLNLPNPDRYTGHSIRRSSATIYANTGATIEALKRHTGHKSTKVCEMYIDNSMEYKKKTGNAITSSINCSSISGSSTGMTAKRTATATESNPSRIVSDAPPFKISRSILSDITNDYDRHRGRRGHVTATVTNNNIGDTDQNRDGLGANGRARATVNNNIVDTDENADLLDTGIMSQSFAGSQQMSTQNFLAQVGKRFAFHKCDKLTINFGK